MLVAAGGDAMATTRRRAVRCSRCLLGTANMREEHVSLLRSSWKGCGPLESKRASRHFHNMLWVTVFQPIFVSCCHRCSASGPGGPSKADWHIWSFGTKKLFITHLRAIWWSFEQFGAIWCDSVQACTRADMQFIRLSSYACRAALAVVWVWVRVGSEGGQNTVAHPSS